MCIAGNQLLVHLHTGGCWCSYLSWLSVCFYGEGKGVAVAEEATGYDGGAHGRQASICIGLHLMGCLSGKTVANLALPVLSGFSQASLYQNTCNIDFVFQAMCAAEVSHVQH